MGIMSSLEKAYDPDSIPDFRKMDTKHGNIPSASFIDEMIKETKGNKE